MLSYIQQYLIYILAGIIAVCLIVIGVQTVRLTLVEKDLIAANEKVKAEAAINLANKGTLSQLKTESDALQARLALSQNAILEMEKRHAEYVRKLLTIYPSPISGECKDMVEWAKQVAIRRDK